MTAKIISNYLHIFIIVYIAYENKSKLKLRLSRKPPPSFLCVLEQRYKFTVKLYVVVKPGNLHIIINIISKLRIKRRVITKMSTH